ncbi:hypothetical protein Drose_17815 [Dactylosporangium roseum]|uniref:Uncharacterized protein n=1 Tax=Dactylosporangium roseum TaxID=47989 RepID=A0ABY5ZGM3_9ACTN|nr:cytochrome P450 [Dactylosporangium roseum]UWZ39897.1 hypothetical protein Drose_17815 [Dactylosporangium roseum]
MTVTATAPRRGTLRACGLPFLDSALDMGNDPGQLLARVYRAHGPVFRTRLPLRDQRYRRAKARRYEAGALFAGGAVTDDVKRIPTVRYTLMETVRLDPVAVAMVRAATRDLEFAGHPIREVHRLDLATKTAPTPGPAMSFRSGSAHRH